MQSAYCAETANVERAARRKRERAKGRARFVVIQSQNLKGEVDNSLPSSHLSHILHDHSHIVLKSLINPLTLLSNCPRNPALFASVTLPPSLSPPLPSRVPSVVSIALTSSSTTPTAFYSLSTSNQSTSRNPRFPFILIRER